jgi:hypothetical protein
MRSGQEWQSWVGGESLYGNGGATLIYRFQRVSPMEISPFNARVIYYGSQHVHRSLDEGITWQKISPDLTAFPPGEPQEASGTPITLDVTGEEVYSTLYAIRESPIQKGLIWTGANDGPFYVSRDDGKTWTNVTPKDLPPGGRVQNIEPSPHRPGTAYYAVYRFLLGDFAPYAYRTDDFGRTWKRITDGANGIAPDEPVRVVREDPDRAHLLYAGTEFGMYVSFDDGAHWQPFQLNLPATPVTDIKVWRKDLVLSTMGRAFWILDNVTPLHQLNEQVATAPASLFTPREAVRRVGGRGGGGRGGGVQYPPPGAMIDYTLRTAPAGDIRLEVLDSTGKVVRSFTSAAPAGGGRAAVAAAAQPGEEEGGGGGRGGGPQSRLEKSVGMHRFYWDLRYPGPWQSAAQPEGGNGPLAVPGKYQVRLTVGSWTAVKPLTVTADPRVAKDGVTTADLRALFAHNIRVRDLVSDVNRTVARVREAQQRLRSASGAAADTLAKVNEIASRLITPSIRYSKPELQTHITYLYSMTTQADQRVPKDAADRYVVLRKQLDDIQRELARILGIAM